MASSRFIAAAAALALALTCGVWAQDGEPHLTVGLEILNRDEAFAGKELNVLVNMVSRGFAGRFDTVLKYDVRKMDGTLVSSESETVAVEVRSSLSRRVHLGADMEGDYVLEVSAEAVPKAGEASKASQTFHVSKVGRDESGLYNIMIAGLIAIFMAAILYEHHRVDILFRLSEDSLRSRGGA